MIVGSVQNREAVIDVEVSGSGRARRRVQAIIDTGFNGYLTLPESLAAELKLQSAGYRLGRLADGSVTRLEVCIASVEWIGGPKEVLVLRANGQPLVGMSLLEGCRLMIEVVGAGAVRIEAMVS